MYIVMMIEKKKIFQSYFLLKKANSLIFVFVSTLFSTRKSSKVVNLPVTDEKLYLCF